MVVDASAAVELLERESGSSRLDERLTAQVELHAPHLIDLEVLNSLRGLVRGRKASEHRAAAMREDFDDLALVRYAHEPFADRIWDLRSSLTPYDASYVALAEELGAVVVTCDAKLAAGAPDGVEIELYSVEAER